MNLETTLLLCIGVLIVAFLYSSVGHAGASGYIAVMTLVGLAPETIRPAALVLNILVAFVTFAQFRQAGHFSMSLFWPFAASSVPMAFVGGYLSLPTATFKILIGLILLYSAAYFLFRPGEIPSPRPPSVGFALGVGAALGLLSGLTGVGGGIFLSPLMLLMHWARTKTVAGISSLFILVNSIAGLAGNLSSSQALPDFALPLVVAAVAGGAIGAHVGSRRLSPGGVKRLLAIVLIIAGIKLIIA